MVLTSKDGFERKDLEDRTPMIIREKTEKWKQRRKEQEKTSINMKKEVDTEFFL